MQSTAYYTSNIYVNNCFLWQARIQLDMQIFTYQNPWCVQVILDASENIYVYIFTLYTHIYMYKGIYTPLHIYCIHIYT